MTQPTRIRALAVAIAGTFVVGVLTVVSGTLDEEGPGHPDEWDPRVADLATFVEHERDLEFDHPVFVDFLTPEEYSELTTTSDEALVDEDRTQLDLSVSQLRALGLASGPVDLFAALNDVSDGGTLAFYAPDDQRVRVRGTEMTVGLEVTLVHELTHALQDQHFDLGGVLDDDLDSSESTARRGLAEGDATRIEQAYVDEELTEDEQAAYDEEYQGEIDESEIETSTVPDSVQALFAVPYALGAPFVATLVSEGGNDAVDDAFRDPPTTEEHLFDPASYLAHEEGAETGLALEDVELLDEGPFGSPSWYLVLAERLDPHVALQATLGWGGDHYGVYERDGRTCIRMAFTGDTEGDETEIREALADWAEVLPGDLTSPIEVDGHPGIDACDPGPDVDMAVVGRSSDALVLPNLFGYLVSEGVAVLDPDGSRCFASRVVEDLSYEQLLAPDAEEALFEQVQETAMAAYAECGSGET